MDNLNILAASSAFLAKLKLGVGLHTVFVLPGLIRDSETGQVNWNNVFTGVLTAGLLASGSSLISLSNKVSELNALASQRGAMIDQLPAILEKLRAQEKLLDNIASEKAAATTDRFRASDAIRLENQLESRFMRELHRLEDRLDRDISKGGRKP